MSMKMYILIKRGLYWRPNAAGYTGLKAEAGHYTLDEARAHCRNGEVTMIADIEAPVFSPACPPDVRQKAEAKFDHGGQAFPRTLHANGRVAGSVPGMTLWDIYAAHALAGALMHGYRNGNTESGYIDARASWAACHADAMLAERRKRFGETSND